MKFIFLFLLVLKVIKLSSLKFIVVEFSKTFVSPIFPSSSVKLNFVLILSKLKLTPIAFFSKVLRSLSTEKL